MLLQVSQKRPKTFEKMISYQDSQLFRGNTNGTFNQYHHAAQVGATQLCNYTCEMSVIIIVTPQIQDFQQPVRALGQL